MSGSERREQRPGPSSAGPLYSEVSRWWQRHAWNMYDGALHGHNHYPVSVEPKHPAFLVALVGAPGYEASSYPKEQQGIKSKVKSLQHNYYLVDLNGCCIE